jgi:hypothetical protein
MKKYPQNVFKNENGAKQLKDFRCVAGNSKG